MCNYLVQARGGIENQSLFCDSGVGDRMASQEEYAWLRRCAAAEWLLGKVRLDVEQVDEVCGGEVRAVRFRLAIEVAEFMDLVQTFIMRTTEGMHITLGTWRVRPGSSGNFCTLHRVKADLEGRINRARGLVEGNRWLAFRLREPDPRLRNPFVLDVLHTPDLTIRSPVFRSDFELATTALQMIGQFFIDKRFEVVHPSCARLAMIGTRGCRTFHLSLYGELQPDVRTRGIEDEAPCGEQ